MEMKAELSKDIFPMCLIYKNTLSWAPFGKCWAGQGSPLEVYTPSSSFALTVVILCKAKMLVLAFNAILRGLYEDENYIHFGKWAARLLFT